MGRQSRGPFAGGGIDGVQGSLRMRDPPIECARGESEPGIDGLSNPAMGGALPRTLRDSKGMRHPLNVSCGLNERGCGVSTRERN